MLNTEKKGSCTCQACGKPKELTTEELVTDFFYWHDAKSVKDGLWLCFSTALSSDEIDDWTGIDRSNLAFNYQKITEFISKLESIHLKMQSNGSS